MEEVAKARGQSLDELDLDAKEALWQTVKKNLKD
jgi:hypothetical protein